MMLFDIMGPQASCCLWQGETAPDGQATNAPLSESNMDGLFFYGCEKGIYYRQPNGFLEQANPTLYNIAPVFSKWR